VKGLYLVQWFILRDQAEVQSCAGYNYIPHGVPMESGTDECHWVNSNPKYTPVRSD